MKIGWYIVGGVAAYLIYKSWMIAKAINTFQYQIKSVRYNASNSNILRTELAVTLNVNNITDQPISFQSFVGTANIKNVPVAYFNIGNKIDIHPGSNDLLFPVLINHISLADSIKEIIDEWKVNDDGALISISGHLTAAGLTVPINQTLLLNQDAVINGLPDAVQTESILPEPFAFSNY